MDRVREKVSERMREVEEVEVVVVGQQASRRRTGAWVCLGPRPLSPPHLAPPQYVVLWDVGTTKGRGKPREKRPSCSHPFREREKRRLHLKHMRQFS
jgi:hypothetical protein